MGGFDTALHQHSTSIRPQYPHEQRMATASRLPGAKKSALVSHANMRRVASSWLQRSWCPVGSMVSHASMLSLATNMFYHPMCQAFSEAEPVFPAAISIELELQRGTATVDYQHPHSSTPFLPGPTGL